MNVRTSLTNLRARALRWVELPDRSWAPALGLMYLGLLFLPVTWPIGLAGWLGPTLLTLPVFLLLYFRHFRPGTRPTLLEPVAMAVLGCALVPFNGFANTYLVYSAALVPFVLPGFVKPLAYTLALLIVYAIEIRIVRTPLLVLGITVLIAPAACIGNIALIRSGRKTRALQMSNAEVRRLAAIAERERIGRDLHDLLGHTLSLIAIKSELAEKLIKRDPGEAAREIADVKNTAREALKEVRGAISGFRSAELEGELAAARGLLESSGVKLSTPRADTEFPAGAENTIAMVLREAVTNIHRHSGARHASIEIRGQQGGVELVVSDDGRGGIDARGNGLSGMGERVQNAGGTLAIESPAGRGTVLRVRLPAPQRA